MAVSEIPSTSPTLLRRLRDPADREAWAAFADSYGRRIFTWCRRWNLQEADAEDLTQGLLVKIPAKMRSFQYDPKTGSFRAWLKTVVRHSLSDFLRSRAREGKTSYALLESVEAEQDLIKELDERFERELRKASLKHDHIVAVHRFEKPAGFPPYLVMEFVKGETLEARLKREGRLNPEAAANIARQVALGLAAAHENGMVHRDIKPANILLEEHSARAKISDFGLARDVANESIAVTGAGELAGTVPYMSPEHFRAPEKLDGVQPRRREPRLRE